MNECVAEESSGSALFSNGAHVRQSISSVFPRPLGMLTIICVNDLPRWDSDIAGLVNIVGSTIGFGAVLYSNARAAKFFLRSQILTFVMGQVNLFTAFARSKAKLEIEDWAMIALFDIFCIFWIMYGLKVRIGDGFSALRSFNFFSCAPRSLCAKASIVCFDSRDCPNL